MPATLTEIKPGQFKEEDLHWINLMRDKFSRGLDMDALGKAISVQGLIAYRISGEKDRGIWITQLSEYETGREFNIFGLAGNLTAQGFNEILKQHIELAKQYNCRWIGGDTEDGRIKKFLERNGFEVVSQHLSFELRNGVH